MDYSTQGQPPPAYSEVNAPNNPAAQRPGQQQLGVCPARPGATPRRVVNAQKTAEMDYSRQGQPPPAYSEVNAPTSQPCPHRQSELPYQPPCQPGQQQPRVNPARPGAAYAPTPRRVVNAQKTAEMDYSRQGQPPAYSEVNAPTNQPYPHSQAETPYQPPCQPGQLQPRVNPARPGAAYAPTSRRVVVTQPGTVIAGSIGTPPPPDYMAVSIFVCVFCFCPTGIVAIYFAYRRNRIMAEGDMVDAQSSADCARNLVIASVVCGFIWMLLVLIWFGMIL